MVRVGLGLLVVSLVSCGSSDDERRAQPHLPPPVHPTQHVPDEPAEPPERMAPTVDIPPYDYEPLADAEHAVVCANSAMPRSPFTCEQDSDCRICHDGSSCGVPVNTDELVRRGADCQREDAAQCEYAAVRCCDGHCQVVSR